MLLKAYTMYGHFCKSLTVGEILGKQKKERKNKWKITFQLLHMFISIYNGGQKSASPVQKRKNVKL